MRMTVLIDNRENENLAGEWGLSIHIAYGGKQFLLDCGTTGAFAENAEKLGIDLGAVDYGILSHAHYDHSDGWDAFFAKNNQAKFYLRPCGENCYSLKPTGLSYIGIRRGSLEAFRERLEFVNGEKELTPGVWLLPHTDPTVEEAGRRAKMFVLEGGELVPEKFSHEQSLIFRAEKGLVIFNSCCHGGAATIIREVQKRFPDETVYALVGGLHLFRSEPGEVRTLARQIRQTGISQVITGHCTGSQAMEILRSELGDKLTEMYSGLTVDFT